MPFCEKIMEIHQLTPMLNKGDAIGDHTLQIRDIIRSLGYESNIYAMHWYPEASEYCFHYSEHIMRSSKSNMLIYHHSIGGMDVTPYFLKVPDRKVMIYHNITPPSFFQGYSDFAVDKTTKGREELPQLKEVVEISLADSEYNAIELREHGFNNIHVQPIAFNNARFKNQLPNAGPTQFYNDDTTNLLFVGRVAPNKKHEDIILAFDHYKREYNPNSRLFLVGTWSGSQAYLDKLLNLLEELQLRDVIFTGHVSFGELLSYYQMADIFICMSEHEGFCVPLLESMYYGLPVLAFRGSGIPYTLGDSSPMVDKKDPALIASQIHNLISNQTLRQQVIAGQKERLKLFSIERASSLLKESLQLEQKVTK